MCGILDNLGNKLCYPNYLKCPLNYITTNKSDSNYTKYGSASLLKKMYILPMKQLKMEKLLEDYLLTVIY